MGEDRWIVPKNSCGRPLEPRGVNPTAVLPSVSRQQRRVLRDKTMVGGVWHILRVSVRVRVRQFKRANPEASIEGYFRRLTWVLHGPTMSA